MSLFKTVVCVAVGFVSLTAFASDDSWFKVAKTTVDDSTIEIEGSVAPDVKLVQMSYNNHPENPADYEVDVYFNPSDTHFTKKIHLRRGPGKYSLYFFTSTFGKIADADHHFKMMIDSSSKVTNADTRDPFLAPSDREQSDDPAIIDLVHRIMTVPEGAAPLSALEKSQRIYSWITSNVSYDWSGRFVHAYSALYTLNSLSATCNGYAALAVALHRAAGIPAKYISGPAGLPFESWTEEDIADPIKRETLKAAWRRILADPDPKKRQLHAWVEVNIGTKEKPNWISEDPTWDAGGFSSSDQKRAAEDSNYVPKFNRDVKTKFFGQSADTFLLTHYKNWEDLLEQIPPFEDGGLIALQSSLSEF